MPNPAPENLTPATDDEVEWTLSFALRYDGRKHYRRADEAMARIVASHLAEHLRRSGYVVQKKSGAASPAIGVRPGWPGLEE